MGYNMVGYGPLAVMMYIGFAGALGPVFLKMAQNVGDWNVSKLLYLMLFVFFYGTGFVGMVWVVKKAPLTLVVPVWYATLLVVAAAAGWVLFGERLSLVGWTAYGLILLGLVLRLAEAVRP